MVQSRLIALFALFAVLSVVFAGELEERGEFTSLGSEFADNSFDPTVYATCQVWGDPHWNTFDGRVYTWMAPPGSYFYSFVSGNVFVWAHTFDCSGGALEDGYVVTAIDYIFVRSGDTVIRLGIYDGGSLATTDPTLASFTPITDGAIQTDILTGAVVIPQPTGGWIVQFNPAEGNDMKVTTTAGIYSSITINRKQYYGQVGGACGYFDECIADEYMGADCKFVTGVNDYGTWWGLQGSGLDGFYQGWARNSEADDARLANWAQNICGPLGGAEKIDPCNPIAPPAPATPAPTPEPNGISSSSGNGNGNGNGNGAASTSGDGSAANGFGGAASSGNGNNNGNSGANNGGSSGSGSGSTTGSATVTPAPATAAPTPSATPAPATPAPATPAPATPAPVTPAPATPAPTVTPAPTPAPVDSSSDHCDIYYANHQQEVAATEACLNAGYPLDVLCACKSKFVSTNQNYTQDWSLSFFCAGYVGTFSNASYGDDVVRQCQNEIPDTTASSYCTCVYDHNIGGTQYIAPSGTAYYVTCSQTSSSCYNAAACADHCNYNGKCVNGACQCNDGYSGATCATKGLTNAAKIAVITAGVLAAIIIGAVAFVALSGYGGVKGYMYMKDHQVSGAHSNPLYNEKPQNNNPFYNNKN